MKRGDWALGREPELALLWSDGHTAIVIAGMIGAPSKSAVLGKVRRMDLPMRITGLKPSGPRIFKIAPPRQIQLLEPVAAGPIGDFPDAGTCRYIAGDPASHDWQCCGAPAERSYCDFHHAVVFQPITAKRKAA